MNWPQKIIFCLVGCKLSLWPDVASVNIQVSPASNDANPGSLRKSVASCAAAQKLERQFAGHETVNVWLHGGTYYLPETEIFTAAGSGTEKGRAIWQAVNMETPVISGGEQLRLTWEPCTNVVGVFQACVSAGLDNHDDCAGATDVVNARRRDGHVISVGLTARI